MNIPGLVVAQISFDIPDAFQFLLPARTKASGFHIW